MKKLVLILGLLGHCIAFSQTYYKTNTIDVLGIFTNTSRTVTPENDILLGGLFQDSFEFEGVQHTFQGGNADAYLAKYDEEGNPIWMRTFGGYFDDAITAICTDNAGNIFVTGYFQGNDGAGFNPFDADPGPDTAYHNQPGPFLTRDAFIIKLDENGDYLWSKQISNTQYASNEDVQTIKCDSEGNVYIGGRFAQADFDPSEERDTILLTTSGKNEGFILKLDTEGEFVWVKHLDGGTNTVQSLYITEENEIFVGGEFERNTNITEDITLTNNALNPYILKLNTDGEYINHFTYGGSDKVYVQEINLINDALFIHGETKCPIVFTEDSTVISDFKGQFDPYLLQLDQDLNYQNSMTVGSKGIDKFTGVSLDDNGNYIVGISFTDSLHINNSVVVSEGKTDIGLINFTEDFEIINELYYGGADDEYIRALFLNSKAELVVIGEFRGDLDMDPSEEVDLFTSSGPISIFISHFYWEVLTSLDENKVEVSVNVYPNPAQDFINISGIENADVNIYNSQGKLVISSTSEKQINISNLTQGHYIIVAKNSLQQANQVFIKQ